jgi:hypothetical protein
MEIMELVMLRWDDTAGGIGGVLSINLITSKEWDLMRSGYRPLVPISKGLSDGVNHTM